MLCWRNWDSHSPHLFPISFLLVLQSLEDEFLGEEKQHNHIKVLLGSQLEEKVYLYLFSWLIKMWFPYSSQSIVHVIESVFVIRCFMLIRLGFHITLIIIVLHVVILFLGRYNSFCMYIWSKRSKRRIEGLLGSTFVCQGMNHTNL